MANKALKLFHQTWGVLSGFLVDFAQIRGVKPPFCQALEDILTGIWRQTRQSSQLLLKRQNRPRESGKEAKNEGSQSYEGNIHVHHYNLFVSRKYPFLIGALGDG